MGVRYVSPPVNSSSYPGKIESKDLMIGTEVIMEKVCPECGKETESKKCPYCGQETIAGYMLVE